MIRVGYTQTDGTDVLHEKVQGSPNANASIKALKASKLKDITVNCFYLEVQVAENEWEKYAFLDKN